MPALLKETDQRAIGKYAVLGVLGQGAMGVVYKALDPEIGRVVAIKTLKKIVSKNSLTAVSTLERFKSEARSAGNLRHPNIVTIFEASHDNDLPYLVMEYVDGDSLERVLQKDGFMPLKRIFQYLKQIASAIDYAHSRGVVHRDIKPGNIIVDTSDTAFILDFGVASIAGAGPQGINGEPIVMGSPGYMSPEQIQNQRVDHRSDLFSLAVVAFECITKQRPFLGDHSSAVIHNILHSKPRSLCLLRQDLPVAIDLEMSRALSSKPAARFSSAQEMIRAFENACEVNQNKKQTAQKEGKNSSLLELPEKPFLTAPQVDTHEPKFMDRLPQFITQALAKYKLSKPRKHVWVQLENSMVGSVTLSDMPLAVKIGGLITATVCLLTGLIILWFSLSKETTDWAISSLLSIGTESRTISQPLVTEIQPGSIIKDATKLTDKQIIDYLLDYKIDENSALQVIWEAQKRKLGGLEDVVIYQLENRSYVVRLEVLKILTVKGGEKGGEKYIDRIAAHLTDADPLVRIQTIKTLSSFDNRKVISMFSSRSLSETNPEVRNALQAAISKLSGFSN